MKRISAIILILALFLCACGKEPATRYEPDLSASELAQYIIAESGRTLDSVQYINDEYEAETLSRYVMGYYGLTEDMWTQCAIYRAQAADEAFEVSIFELTEQADINTVFNELEEYRHGRQGDFFGYNPKQADIVDGAIVSISSDGVWAAVLICEDPYRADEAFFSRLGMSLPEDDEQSLTESFVESSELTAEELAMAILVDNGMSVENMMSVNDSFADAESLDSYVDRVYCLMPVEWTQCYIYRALDSAQAHEISVFKISSTAEPDIVLYNLNNYLHNRAEEFSVDPEQAALVENAKICLSSNGVWVGVFVCSSPERAEEAFNAVLDIRSESFDSDTVGNDDTYPEYWQPYKDPEIDDMTLWDNSAVVAAIKSGDASDLDSEGKNLCKEVNKVLEKHISDDMSPLEKERAVYNWLCANCEYDQRHYEVPNNAPRISYEPYGAIVEGKAICLGFASAFQLFMDVLDIECITVVGGAFQSTEDHAWNMVNLDGKWYCVDATWDAGCDPEWHNYFNVSSDYMALTNHQWDYDVYPMAYSDGDGSWADELWVSVE